MTDLFQNVLTASFHGSIVILAVILLRLLLKKTPKKFFCLLWLLAGIRLLMPFEIQSGLSLQPDMEVIAQSHFSEMITENEVVGNLPAAMPEQADPAQIQQPQTVVPMPETESVPGEISIPYDEMTIPEEQDIFLALDEIAAYIWVAVAFGFALHTVASYLRLKFQVREAIRLRGNIWECDRIETAFILGFIRPQIYLPMGMSRNNRRHILAHEQTHLEKGDHWFKMIGYLALAIHWFNPLVWVAYVLLCRDIESACDERVVQFMELEERKSYSAALLNCSTNHAHFAACPVAFGEVSVKNRVMRVLNYKKPSFWISLAGVVAIIFVAVCLVTSPAETEQDVIPETTEATIPRETVTVATVDELLAAIAPETEIILEAGSYNLSEASTYGGDADSTWYRWTEISDGYELVLTNVENLSIRGNGMHVTLIETDPRYADVLAMIGCHDVELEGITLGHTREKGECSGGVLDLMQSSGIHMNGLGLYGCGVVGLKTDTCADVTLTNSDIYECSSSAASLNSSHGVTISGCRIYNIGEENYGGYTYFEIQGCRDVVISDCELSDSDLGHMLCAYSSMVEVKNNLVMDNRFVRSVMNLQGNDGGTVDVELSKNKFTDNSIRSWYMLSDAAAHDEKGKRLTEEVLNDEYGTEPTEPQEPQLEIHVSTVDEFIAAIGPDRDIVLDAELYDLSTATGYGTSKGDYYFWEDIFDGPGLVIQNVSNMTIRSGDGNVKGHTLAAVPRYADVLSFRSCSHITISGITAGHTKEQGSCAGGVLEFMDSDAITVDNCGLFGCGTVGVHAENCSDILVKDTEIYECSEGGIKMWESTDVTIKNTTFRDIGGDSILMFSGCKDVRRDSEQLIPEDRRGTLEIRTPEQEEMQDLRAAVWGFVDAYRSNDVQTLKNYLASSYQGDCSTWSEGEDYGDTTWVDVTVDQVRKIRETGSCSFTVIVRDWSFEQSNWIREGVLTVTVVQEDGVYKVSDYLLEQNEA